MKLLYKVLIFGLVLNFFGCSDSTTEEIGIETNTTSSSVAAPTQPSVSDTTLQPPSVPTL